MSARRALRAAGASTLAALVVALAPGTAAAQSCLIELTGTDEAVHFHGLAPGDERAWWTGVRNTSGGDIALSVRATGSGPLAAALDLAVHACDEPWQGDVGGAITCPGTTDQLLASRALDDLTDDDLDLGTVPAGGLRHLRFTAAMRPDAGDEFQATTGSATATFVASGEGGTCVLPPPDEEDDTDPAPTTPTTTEPTAPTTSTLPQRPAGPPDPGGAPDDSPRSPRRGPGGPRGPLVVTGSEVAGPLVLGLGLVGAGALADLYRRRRNRDPRRRGS